MAIDPTFPDPRSLLPADRPIQLLDADGTFTEDPDWPIDLDDAQLAELYRLMVMARQIDAQAITLQRQGQLGVYASLRGQEAAQIGTAFALAAQDFVFPSYREMGVALVRGVDPADLLHVFRGTWLGAHDPAKHRFALITISIATQALHAAGFAMGAKLDGSDSCAVAYMGDGATSEGDAHEAFNFASVFGAPCVFVVQNNQYAISVPLTRQTKAPTIAHKGIGYGMPGYRCDGNDVLGTYAVMRQALRHAREGNGPVLIEAVTYRMEAHTTADDPTRYREDTELEQWRARDPITRLEKFLRDRELVDDEVVETVAQAAKAEAQSVRAALYDAPHGDPMELFSHVYAEPTQQLRDQHELLQAELQGQDA
ncbi:MAG: pyruvate dehydrogenase (acetyl-transferring) E1 component subunit alpha [Actinobacteria bacterium]|nr:pyruvate dehydrogenase (acetyl-transferring) E1 component subunit alpha [Actinomycetota bacterium]